MYYLRDIIPIEYLPDSCIEYYDIYSGVLLEAVNAPENAKTGDRFTLSSDGTYYPDPEGDKYCYDGKILPLVCLCDPFMKESCAVCDPERKVLVGKRKKRN